jgi:hypothetical protein
LNFQDFIEARITAIEESQIMKVEEALREEIKEVTAYMTPDAIHCGIHSNT